MATNWLNDFLRNLFEAYRAEKIPRTGIPPKPLPKEVGPRLRQPGSENEAQEVEKMSEFALPIEVPRHAKHTFLFDESVWLVSGVYINEKSVSVDLEGDSVISHWPERWLNEVNLKLKTDDNGEYRNRQYKTVFQFTPIESTLEPSEWHAFHPLLGRLRGVLVFVDDTILSAYQTTNGNIRGMETLRMISEYEYQCRGALMEGGKRSSSWILRYDKG